MLKLEEDLDGRAARGLGPPVERQLGVVAGAAGGSSLTALGEPLASSILDFNMQPVETHFGRVAFLALTSRV